MPKQMLRYEQMMRDAMWYANMTWMYAHLIESRTPFAQANYGDGEWGAMMGLSITNTDGTRYTPQLGKWLRWTLEHPSGMWCGTNPGDRLRADVDAWIARNEINVPWMPKEILSEANVNGQIAPFFRAVRAWTGKRVLVGPKHLHVLPVQVVGPVEHVEIPDHVAWTVTDRIADDLRGLIVPGNVTMIMFSAGMATNIVMNQLWKEYRGEVTMIDTGAIFDPYVGVLSRKGYHKPSFTQAMKENLR